MSLSHSLPVDAHLHEYRIESVLGQGAFAITYRAWDENLQSSVAIKEYFPGELMCREPSGVANLAKGGDAELYEWGLSRFISEAQVLAQFKHPSIVRVSRYFPANRTAYIVMDYEKGESLLDRLSREGGPLPETELRSLLLPLLSGLKLVHEKHYLHRDIKPANIYLREDGSPVLLDFGAARMEFGTSGGDGLNVLTPRYAPIEQYSPDGVQGPWSDIYSLGATLFRCMTGQAPVDAQRRDAEVGEGKPDPFTPSARLLSGRYGRDVLEAVDWMLQLRPADRPQSAAELIARLTGAVSPAVSSAESFSYVPRRAQRVHKIVFAGPVGAGKTTAIATLSHTPILRTDERASDMTRERKNATTVAMDFGVMNLSDTERVHLYGMPGQERFDFMWKILEKGALGLVLLIDNSRRAPLDDLAFYLSAFKDLLSRTQLAVGVNFTERSPKPTLDDYHSYFRERRADLGLNPPIFEVDPRNPREVGLLVEALLYTIDPGVQNYDV
ncbi:MAG: protein kinase [Betaproteobacteria bacterium]|nr:protein kinase [Betaproteobacteria bacterium]